MSEPDWLSKEFVISLHESVINKTGGLHGVRDEALLESALSRPQNAYHYENADIFDLAAAYAEGIARNHPFLDGNKRTAFAAAGMFLEDNSYELQIERGNEQEAIFLGLAEGKISRAELAEWYRQNTQEILQEIKKEVEKKLAQENIQQAKQVEPEKALTWYEVQQKRAALHKQAENKQEQQRAPQSDRVKEGYSDFDKPRPEAEKVNTTSAHAEKVKRRYEAMMRNRRENNRDFDYTRDRSNEPDS